MNPTDEELDREWKPSGRRPQSTMARSFSAELMDIFKIDESVTDLDEKVDKRKQTISLQTNELQSLETRLREMEDRLKSKKPDDGSSSSSTEGSPAQNQRRTLSGSDSASAPPPPPPKDSSQAASSSKRSPPSDLYTATSKSASTSAPVTSSKSGGPRRPVGGYMPPTPGASEGTFVAHLR